jgi:hypothetical protein
MTDFKPGDRVMLIRETQDVFPPFRIMAVADGYAMMRRPRCIPTVARLSELCPSVPAVSGDPE